MAEQTKEASEQKIRLAHHPTRRVAIEGTDKTAPAYHTPPTANGEVNIYGEPPLYLPSLDDQKAGFTPLLVATRNGRPTHARYRVTPKEKIAPEARILSLQTVTTEAGSTLELDTESGAEATRLLLAQFPGTYKPTTEASQ